MDIVAKPNTTLKLTPGERYSITGLTGNNALPVGCLILGRENTTDPYPIVAMNTSHGYAIKNTYPGFGCKGVKFEGGGVFVENAIDFNFADNEIVQRATTGKRCGLELSAMAKNFHIVGNLFTGDNGAFGMYSASGFESGFVSNNHFIDLAAGIHFANDSVFKDFVFDQNYLKGIRAQAVEFQGRLGDLARIIIQDNWVEGHRISANAANNGAAYSYSVPLEGSNGTIIRRNVSIQKKSADEPDKIGVRIIYEIGGKHEPGAIFMEDNYSDGGNHVIAGNGAGGTGNARNNRLSNYREPPRNKDGVSIAYTNNGPGVVLPVDLIARGRPQRWSRFGQAPDPTPVPPVPVDEVEKLKAQVKALNETLSIGRVRAGENLLAAQRMVEAIKA